MEFTDVGGILLEINKVFSWTCRKTAGEKGSTINQGKPVSIHYLIDIVCTARIT
jgi:hypothetical protein